MWKEFTTVQTDL